jgi:hypothetical protein
VNYSLQSGWVSKTANIGPARNKKTSGVNMAENIDWRFCCFLFFFALFFFLQAYFNLIKKRISPFGMDALLISLLLTILKRKQREIIKKDMKNPKRIRKIGIDALLLGFGCIWGIIYYLLPKIGFPF